MPSQAITRGSDMVTSLSRGLVPRIYNRMKTEGFPKSFDLLIGMSESEFRSMLRETKLKVNGLTTTNRWRIVLDALDAATLLFVIKGWGQEPDKVRPEMVARVHLVIMARVLCCGKKLDTVQSLSGCTFMFYHLAALSSLYSEIEHIAATADTILSNPGLKKSSVPLLRRILLLVVVGFYVEVVKGDLDGKRCRQTAVAMLNGMLASPTGMLTKTMTEDFCAVISKLIQDPLEQLLNGDIVAPMEVHELL